MAVLKSPKNNGTKRLWARRAATRVKATSNYFYLNEHQLIKSNLKSFGIKHDHTLDPKKYRFIGDVHKEEKRLLGEILPSTLTKPKPVRSRKTFGSKEWEQKFTFQKEFFMLANSQHFSIAPKTKKLKSFFQTSRKYSKVKITQSNFRKLKQEEMRLLASQPSLQPEQPTSTSLFSKLMKPIEWFSNKLKGL